MNNDQYWLGSVGFSSSYFNNNFDSLCLLMGVIIKYFILKILLTMVCKNINKKIKITFEGFYKYFIG
jgi:hypothetical protein